MTLLIGDGAPDRVIAPEEMQAHLRAFMDKVGPRPKRVLLLPPDHHELPGNGLEELTITGQSQVEAVRSHLFIESNECLLLNHIPIPSPDRRPTTDANRPVCESPRYEKNRC